MLDALTARFDDKALRAPDLVPFDPSATTLRDWCFEDFEQAFAARSLPPAAAPAVAALACDLDGTYRLFALGRLGRLGLRLATKLNDLHPWRSRRRDDPWDCGHARDDLAALGRFRPRRATLVIVEGRTRADAQRIEALLAANAPQFRHPVRLVIVDQRLE